MTRSESIAHAIADRAEESGMSLPDFLADQAMMVMAQRLGDATRAALAQAFDDAAAPLPEKPREPTLSEMLETERYYGKVIAR